VTAATALALAIVAALALGAGLRDEVSRAGDPPARTADGLAARIDPARTAEARALLASSGADARLIGPAGRVRLQTGPDEAVWRAPGASWSAALATAGSGGWTLRAGAVQASRSLANGQRIVLRAPLPAGAGTMPWPGPPLIVAGIVLSLLAGLAAWLLGARRARRARGLAGALEAMAAGRPAVVAPEGRGDWRRLSGAAHAALDRAEDLRAAAESRMEAFGAALAPLAHPVAARTPSGGLIRNDALERLVGAMAAADAAQVEDALRTGLSSSGAVSRRLTLSDGRALEVDAWAVPGGRVVAVGERTEQARMETVRRQVTGAAARHLQAPVSEVQALGSDLLGQVPASAVPTVRRIQSAGDRMERLVSQLLRGTANDPRARPLRLRPLGAAGIAYGLGRAFDRRLRDRGLRLETALPTDLPPVRTDAALVHEVLSELIANAATFTPRGGTITLAGRRLPGGAVELSVTDTGPGIGGDELALVGERFGRGAAASGFPGAGLGLGVATALAERLGGRLTIEPGPGGRARLELPAALVPRTEAPEPDPPAEAAPVSEAAGAAAP
jgi:signal transduction histidine kinase